MILELSKEEIVVLNKLNRAINFDKNISTNYNVIFDFKFNAIVDLYLKQIFANKYYEEVVINFKLFTVILKEKYINNFLENINISFEDELEELKTKLLKIFSYESLNDKKENYLNLDIFLNNFITKNKNENDIIYFYDNINLKLKLIFKNDI